nr:beta-alanine--pyruvate aminotransferase [Francisella halioticida]
MRLVDEFISFNNEIIHCRSTIRENNLFFIEKTNSIPHWVSIEMMAQTSAVYSKVNNPDPCIKPSIGFLLSIRKYKTSIKEYKLGNTLDIFAECIVLDKGTGVFNCKVKLNNSIVATVTMNAYQPEDINDTKKILKRGF